MDVHARLLEFKLLNWINNSIRVIREAFKPEINLEDEAAADEDQVMYLALCFLVINR